MDTAWVRIAVAVALDFTINVFDATDGGCHMAIHDKGVGTEVLRGPWWCIHVGDEMNKAIALIQE
jgi:hypothetical protein